MATTDINKAQLKDQTGRLFELDQWIVTYGGQANALIIGKVVGFTPKQVAFVSLQQLEYMQQHGAEPYITFGKPFQTVIADRQFM